jgi:DNA-directed RNA polymerase subunit RPC12/RpoP
MERLDSMLRYICPVCGLEYFPSSEEIKNYVSYTCPECEYMIQFIEASEEI